VLSIEKVRGTQGATQTANDGTDGTYARFVIRPPQLKKMINRCLIVTGGSRGIGAAVSRLAHAQGFNVCVNFQSNELQAQALVKEILGRSPMNQSFEKHGPMRLKQSNAVAIRADVSCHKQVQFTFAL